MKNTSPAIFCYLMQIAYNGKNYFGWQRQKEFSNTVQGELLRAFIRISGKKTVKVLGSSRTDSGVHALAQFCKVTLEMDFAIPKLMIILSSILPSDIQIIKIEKIDPDFRLMSEVQSKTYQYLFLPGQFTVPPVAADWILPYSKQVDVDLLHKAAKIFLGEHNFMNYKVVGTITKTDIRTIYRSEVELLSEVSFPLPWIPKGTMRYVIEGNGFLNQMVRLIVGAILRAAEGKIDLDQLKESLIQRCEKRIAAPVPAYGLTLMQTKFRK